MKSNHFSIYPVTTLGINLAQSTDCSWEPITFNYLAIKTTNAARQAVWPREAKTVYVRF